MSLRATNTELERFRLLIRGMSHESAIYKLLKQELSGLGYWRNRARGKPNLDNLQLSRHQRQTDTDLGA